MTSASYGESADAPALLRPRDQLLGGQSDDNNRRNDFWCCSCCRRDRRVLMERAFFQRMGNPKTFRRLFYILTLLAFVGWLVFVAGFTFRRERNTDDASVHFNRMLFAWWLVAIEGGVFFTAVFLTVFVYNLLTMATSIFFMLIYLICVGAVLQGDGNWLYDHWGSGTETHSAVLIETSGLIFTIIFSIPSTTMLYTVGIHFANRREQELSRYNIQTL